MWWGGCHALRGGLGHPKTQTTDGCVVLVPEVLAKEKTSNEEEKEKRRKIDKDRQGTSEERSAILWNAVALSLSLSLSVSQQTADRKIAVPTKINRTEMICSE